MLKRITMTAAAFCGFAALAPASAAGETAYIDRSPEDEVIYFVLPDRFENADPSNDLGGFPGGRLDHGYDPTHKGFFHGGDLKGLTKRLDYIQRLGATAIWLGPIYKNKPVQGQPGDESAGYHGYWITDFTSVDPHFGTNDDLKIFVDAAHERGLKVYLDIIVNHTADVIKNRECEDDPHYNTSDSGVHECAYRYKADYPYSTRGPAEGEAINEGFLGDDPQFQTPENFERLKESDFAYSPYVPAGEENIKIPAWLNDPIYYHNRGNSNWVGESSLYGDFSGLDDLFTEHPRVLAGMIEIFQNWITEYRMDGFRIDTARHVGPEFWQGFIPAMLETAKAEGIPNFYIFGEAYSPDAAGLARFTRVDGFPAVLDFAFQSAVQDVIVNGKPTSRLEELFKVDDLYEGREKTTRKLPVFIGNHDMGRFAMFVRQGDPSLDNDEVFKRVKLAHAMMFFLRGAPVIYYGDEQGFNGDGNDQASREDMFPSQVASFNDNDLIGSNATTAEYNFNHKHPLYKTIADMAKIFHKHPALRRGAQQVRKAERDGGVFAVTRRDDAGGEYLVVFNASAEQRDAHVGVDPRSEKWKKISGACPRRSIATGSVKVSLAPWDYMVCKSNSWSAGE